MAIIRVCSKLLSRPIKRRRHRRTRLAAGYQAVDERIGNEGREKAKIENVASQGQQTPKCPLEPVPGIEKLIIWAAKMNVLVRILRF